jgi:ankyrin repeat protein
MSTGLHEIANIRKTFDMDDWTSGKMRTYALSERRLLVFEALLQWGAATSRRNNQGKTAMDLAINNGDKELQELILSHSLQ